MKKADLDAAEAESRLITHSEDENQLELLLDPAWNLHFELKSFQE